MNCGFGDLIGRDRREVSDVHRPNIEGEKKKETPDISEMISTDDGKSKSPGSSHCLRRYDDPKRICFVTAGGHRYVRMKFASGITIHAVTRIICNLISHR
jgi:hypothetical protein